MFDNKMGRTLSAQESRKVFLNQKSILLSSLAPSAHVFWFSSMFFIAQPAMFIFKPYRAYIHDREKTCWITLFKTVSQVAEKQKVPPWESPL